MSNEYDSIQRILSKLKEQPDVKLKRSLTEAEVSAFESKHGVRLPEGYRLFLLHVGNGGDGPTHYTGLAPLPIETKEFSRENAIVHLDKPFPLTEYLVWCGIEIDEIDWELVSKCQEHGQLFLGDDGCNISWVIIVTGAERGQVWNIYEDGAQPCAPKLSFLEWYEKWLDWRSSPSDAEWPDLLFAEFEERNVEPVDEQEAGSDQSENAPTTRSNQATSLWSSLDSPLSKEDTEQWFFASMDGNVTRLKELLEQGMPVNVCTQGGTTALMLAAKSGKIEAVSMLLARGADPNLRGDNGWTAAGWATSSGSPEVREALRRAGAIPSDVWDAVYLGDLEATRRFVEAKTDVNVRDENGTRPLMYAAMVNEPEIVRLLLKAGAKIDSADTDGGRATHYAMKTAAMASTEVLLEFGADPNSSDRSGCTPLNSLAFISDRFETLGLARILIDRGADVNRRDKQGHTPLSNAVEAGSLPLAMLLVEAGADPEQAYEEHGASRRSAINRARNKGAFDVVKYIESVRK